MSRNKEKGNAYEKFVEEILLLEGINWSYDNTTVIRFDKSDEKIIYGISCADHQIDIHLISSNNADYHLLCECKTHKNKVEKTHACAFVTVIKDIQLKHDNWKIIPVFIANEFQLGAKQILSYFGIIGLEMEDRRSIKTSELRIEEKVISPQICNISGKLEDGTIVDDTANFNNNYRGDINLGIRNIIHTFELLDENNVPINNLSGYIGKFHTGNRKIIQDRNDIFIEKNKKKKLMYIEGEVTGELTEESFGVNVIPIFNEHTIITVNDGGIYRVYLNGRIKKIQN